MAEGSLPRVSVGRWKGDGPFPGDGPVFWQCNRCLHHVNGCKNDGEAYRQAADHECEPLPPAPTDASSTIGAT